LVVVVAFCELQPIILDAMFDKRPSPFFTAFVIWIRVIIVLLTPIATAIFFRAEIRRRAEKRSAAVTLISSCSAETSWAARRPIMSPLPTWKPFRRRSISALRWRLQAARRRPI